MGSTHLKALAGVPEAQVVAVVSSSERKLSGDLTDIQGNLGTSGERMDFSSLKKYRAIEEALRDSEIDAVDICLPTDQHAPVAIAALRAGKHVLVEKPMALDGATADEMVREAARNGRVLMTGQILRFIDSYRIAARTIKSGELGAVRAAVFRRRCAAPGWSRWLGDRSRSGGGVFDLLIHDVDYCLYVFGRPEGVTARGYENLPRGIDWILAEFSYPPATVAVTGGWHHAGTYPFSMEFTVVADGGTLEYSSTGRPLTLYRADGNEQVLEPAATSDFFRTELAYFVECARRGAAPELCSPEESANAVKLAQSMLQSRARNGERVGCGF